MVKKNNPDYKVRRLGINERIESFDCGDADLNDFILNESFLYRDELLAVSYIMENESGKVIAYFSLANDKVSLSEFDNKTEFNRFRKHRFINEKRLKSYPAVKICRFGVDVSVRNLHLGTQLINFIKWYFITNNKTGCRFITVDAYINAIPFYLKNEFQPLTESDKDDFHTRQLYYDLKTNFSQE
ncbi:GNAT family N-acetyltransferase [Bacteroides sp. GM023]|nr:GNAT family N-acetyltransferase [Bacteroides sp. GM023]